MEALTTNKIIVIKSNDSDQVQSRLLTKYSPVSPLPLSPRLGSSAESVLDDNLCIKWRDKTGMVSGTQWASWPGVTPAQTSEETESLCC